MGLGSRGWRQLLGLWILRQFRLELSEFILQPTETGLEMQERENRYQIFSKHPVYLIM